MHVQPDPAHDRPFLEDQRERGGSHDRDGYALSAHSELVAGAATNNAEFAAHQLERPAHPRLPYEGPWFRGAIVPAGPDGSFIPPGQRLRLPLSDPRDCFPRSLNPSLPHRPGRPQPTGGLSSSSGRCSGLGIRRDLPQQQRTPNALDGWVWHYHYRRRHSALGNQPPLARLSERTKLLGTYT
jgi:hypothetical protein